MEKYKSKIANKILADLPGFEGVAKIEEITNANPEIPKRTLQRWLKTLVDDGEVISMGKASATRYRLAAKGVAAADEGKAVLPLSAAGARVRELARAAIQKRKPVGYRQEFLQSYRPNVDSYLTEEEKAKMMQLGSTGLERPAGTYAQQVLNRLLIDLSWNSSRLEGNTYSLLGTERLIQLGETDENKSAKEAQMILNHKDAIEFLVMGAEDIAYNRYTVTNLHAMLANNLLDDPQAPGRLRLIAVGITGSMYTPLAVPQLVSEYFDLILAKVQQIEDPFEQSFFIMVHLPYLQPFDDVNKRVSRLASNIPFIRLNLAPLSFTDVPEDLYAQGMLGVYEQNDVSLLKDVFIWAYERSASRYAVVRQSLGEPDAFRLKYRTQIRDLVGAVVMDALGSKQASELITQRAKQLPEAERKEFVNVVDTEILSLHEGNFARYRVSPREFTRWREVWTK